MTEAQPPPPPVQIENAATGDLEPATDPDRPCPCCGGKLIEDQLPKNILTDAPEGIANTVLVCSDVTGCGFYEY